MDSFQIFVFLGESINNLDYYLLFVDKLGTRKEVEVLQKFFNIKIIK